MLFLLAIINTTTLPRNQDLNLISQNETHGGIQDGRKYAPMQLSLYEYEKARKNLYYIINNVNIIVSQILLHTEGEACCTSLKNGCDKEKDKIILEKLKSNLKMQLEIFKKHKINILKLGNRQDGSEFLSWWRVLQYNIKLFLTIKNSEIRSIINRINMALELKINCEELMPIIFTSTNSTYQYTYNLLEYSVGENKTALERKDHMDRIIDWDVDVLKKIGINKNNQH